MMKKLKFSYLTQFLTFTVIAFATLTAFAQTPQTADTAAPANDKAKPLLQQLNLNADQINQIRSINRETRAAMREAAQRQREARRALDLAIYADQPNEQEVQRLTLELAAAQAEFTKTRARTEFLIRQVLTKDQLITFRELRRRDAVRKIQSRTDKISQPNRLPRRLQKLQNNPQ